MTKKTATTKETGGGGNMFESMVAARFMAMMIAGHPPLDEELGVIRLIEFQTIADGWPLDDLVLTLRGPRGNSRFALSIKSNQQIRGNRFPIEFVEAAWELWLGRHTADFDRSRDHLGLVVGSLAPIVRVAWDGLFNEARDAGPERILHRLKARGAKNDIQRNLFRSLTCKLPGETVAEVEAVLLMTRIRVLDYDFGCDHSIAEQMAVTVCRDVLETQTRVEAADLWERLQGIARKLNPNGGTLDLAGLIDRLRGSFRLKEYPDYAADVRLITELSLQRLEQVIDKIGDSVNIDRTLELGRISSLLNDYRCVALLGESGAGKSGLAKTLVKDWKSQGPVAWFDVQMLDESSLTSVECNLGLGHSFRKILPNINARSSLLLTFRRWPRQFPANFRGVLTGRGSQIPRTRSHRVTRQLDEPLAATHRAPDPRMPRRYVGPGPPWPPALPCDYPIAKDPAPASKFSQPRAVRQQLGPRRPPRFDISQILCLRRKSSPTQLTSKAIVITPIT